VSRREYIVERIIALIMLLLFLRSAFSHLANPYYFLSSIYSYRIVNQFIAEELAIVVPFVQLTLAILIATRQCLAIAYVCSATVLVTFVVAQASVLFRGMRIACGCFGSESLQVSPGTLSIAVAAFVLCGIGAFLSKPLLKSERWRRGL
jgi:putative oxidoreductase